ncbi:hypothetical protein V6N13_106500 [Hibiscus sabdariffa]
MKGCGHPKFVPALRQYLRDNRPNVVGLVEPHISGAKADSVIASISFPHSYRIEAVASINQPWLLFGDFNATLSADDHMGCALSTKPCPFFRKFLFDYGLRDMGFSGPNFTWRRGCTQVRLDRFLCNMHWDESFLESSVHHLLCMKSDHRPLLLRVGSLHRNHSKAQFRYFKGWHFHEDFRQLVTENWHPSDSLFGTINSFSKVAELWNVTVLRCMF